MLNQPKPGGGYISDEIVDLLRTQFSGKGFEVDATCDRIAIIKDGKIVSEFDTEQLDDAIRAASYNPACALGVQDQLGSVTPGKFADFIICKEDFSDKRVFLNGKEVGLY